MEIPYSEACERNKDPILSTIDQHLEAANSVLEIGTGTAQHAVHFAQAMPHLQWQASDQTHYIQGINAQLDVAKVGNIARPVELDVNQAVWLLSGAKVDLVYTANTFHIMTSADVEAFFKGLPQVLNPGAKVVVYGPFKYKDQFTSDSNAAFDQRLRERGVGSAIRDFEWVNTLAGEQGLTLLEDHNMPANNQCLVWQLGQSH